MGFFLFSRGDPEHGSWQPGAAAAMAADFDAADHDERDRKEGATHAH